MVFRTRFWSTISCLGINNSLWTGLKQVQCLRLRLFEPLLKTNGAKLILTIINKMNKAFHFYDNYARRVLLVSLYHALKKNPFHKINDLPPPPPPWLSSADIRSQNLQLFKTKQNKTKSKLKFALPYLNSAWNNALKWVQTSQVLLQWFLR